MVYRLFCFTNHWTGNRVCEVFDSYSLPLSTYKNPQLQAWFKQWKELITSDMTIQAMDSQTRGDYALMFLKAKARGSSFQEFFSAMELTQFSVK